MRIKYVGLVYGEKINLTNTSIQIATFGIFGLNQVQ